MRDSFRIAITTLCLLIPLARAESTNRPELMPIHEIKPGMEGHWKTVTSGTKIESFPLTVLGIAENLIGPGQSIIICEAADPENILSGPVSGMSGSPVYIDGKLIGAYAYGFPWAKEQAVIGVTPIADMLKIFDDFTFPPSTPARPSRYPAIRNQNRNQNSGIPQSAPLPIEELRHSLRPLPMALSISGISPQTLDFFENEFLSLGLQPKLVPMGKTGRQIDTDLQPGSAVAGVLIDGDFNIAGTGTVTYRDGDRILAFGHPFLGLGDTSLPMAPAEIITIIRSVQSSFKLSNTGPIIGSIHQDRLTAIAGEIGPKPAVTLLTLNIQNDNGLQKSYSGNLFRHPQLSPLISAMALSESLSRTMESSDRQTFFIRANWDIEGHEPLIFEEIATGPNAPMELAFQHLALHRKIADNLFESPEINSITYDISFQNEWLISELESAFIDRQEIKPGETVTLDLVSRNYHGTRSRNRIDIPIPADLISDSATLFIGDAPSAQAHDPKFPTNPTSFNQLLKQARRHLPRQSIYIKLLRPAAGLEIAGEGMPDLLPSVAAILQSPKSETPLTGIAETTIWETEIPIQSEFRGQKTFQLKIK